MLLMLGPILALLFQAKIGTLSVMGFDTQGEQLSTSVIELKSQDGVERSGQWQMTGQISLPYGLYSYKIKVGRSIASGYVNVRDKKKLLVLTGSPDLFDATTGATFFVDRVPSPSLTGRVKILGLVDETNLWVRLQSVHNPKLIRDMDIQNLTFETSAEP